MDFAFSEEQEMLRGQARQFLGERFSQDRIVDLADGDADAWDADAWKQIAELGWIGLSAPENAGGAGMSFLDEAVVFEELGYALAPTPYFSTVALALPALERSPELVEKVVSGQAAATLAWTEREGPTFLEDLGSTTTKAAQTNGSWTVSGSKSLVPDGGAASIVVVVATTGEGIALFAIEGDEGVTRTIDSTMDTTRRYATISFKHAPATLLVGPDEAGDVISLIRQRALVALALEAVGISQRTRELATTHVTERKQFDKPIGTYQAVSHQVADMYVDTELSRSLAYWAAWSVAEQEGATTAALAAKAFASEAAVASAERCIQVHGGIGFTWEHLAHRYYKRAQWIDSFDGFNATQRARLADALL